MYVRKTPVATALFCCFSLLVGGRGLLARSFGYNWSATVSADQLDFSVKESAAAKGLNFAHQVRQFPIPSNVKPWLESIGAALAVADVNEDGLMDIYVVQNRLGAKNALFINQGDGTFRDEAEKYGLADVNKETISYRPIFFDCDNDGHQELLLITDQHPMLYRRGKDGRFQGEEVRDFSGFTLAANVLDLNHDGFLDVVLGGFLSGGMFQPGSLVDSNNGGRLTTLLNDGNCHFKANQDYLKTEGGYFYHSVGIGDLRGTGRKDIWTARDFNQDSVFLTASDGSFHLHQDRNMDSSLSRSGMNSEVMYLSDDLIPSMFVSHVFHSGYVSGGNTLWKWNPDKAKFEDHAWDSGVARCAWAWGGRAIDLNNDGLLDLAVVNGFLRGDRHKDYWYPFGVLSSSGQNMISDTEQWPDMNGKNFSGYERDCLFLNRGGRFIDVASAFDFDSALGEGRGVAVIDADNSGVQDLVVANQGGNLAYYKIEIKEARSWIGFSLESRHGVREAVGAIVTITSEGHRYRREAFTLNTYASQSDPRLHFGLNHAKSVSDVEVQWPSGNVRHYGSLPLNQYHHLVED